MPSAKVAVYTGAAHLRGDKSRWLDRVFARTTPPIGPVVDGGFITYLNDPNLPAEVLKPELVGLASIVVGDIALVVLQVATGPGLAMCADNLLSRRIAPAAAAVGLSHQPDGDAGIAAAIGAIRAHACNYPVSTIMGYSPPGEYPQNGSPCLWVGLPGTTDTTI